MAAYGEDFMATVTRDARPRAQGGSDDRFRLAAPDRDCS
jgi:hypothetical protein